MVAWFLAILRIAAGTVGIAIGFFRLPDVASALDIVTLSAVGIVGLISFASHFVFHESDARRLGWESASPDFQFEVGFANLAFALVAFLAYFGGWGVAAEVVVVLGFALYLLQAGMLHAWRAATGNDRLGRLLRSVVPLFAISGLMIYLAARAIGAAGLYPF